MKLIEKLLIENKVRVCETFSVNFTKGIHKPILHITIEMDKESGIHTKEQLLSEAPAAIFVSTLEWELMNHWKQCRGKTIGKTQSFYDGYVDIDSKDEKGTYVGTTVCISDDALFPFLKLDEFQDLDDLISRAVLIEG